MSFAGRTRDHAHVLLELAAARAGSGLLEAAQELGDDALPFLAVLPDAAAAHLPFEGDVALAGAVQEPVALLLGQIFPRGLEVDVERLGDPFEDVLAPASHAA